MGQYVQYMKYGYGYLIVSWALRILLLFCYAEMTGGSYYFLVLEVAVYMYSWSFSFQTSTMESGKQPTSVPAGTGKPSDPRTRRGKKAAAAGITYSSYEISFQK